VGEVTILEADLSRADHVEAIVDQLDSYSRDPIANRRGLSDEVKRNLGPGLRAHPGTHVFLAYRHGAAVGVAVCFLTFSTFAARRVLNIHDLAVEPEHRGLGVGRSRLERVEERARELGCCKLTLEVQEKNSPAKGLYTQVGFEPYQLASDAGPALFWQKKL
jgi:GNAT superfamily N-acetyltransferase